jgi:archaellin
LPFNVRNQADAIAFTLTPNAGRPEIELQRKKLTARLVSAIDRCMQEPEPSAEQSSATPSTFNKAAYFESDEVLAQAGESNGNGSSYSYSSDTFSNLRLMPMPKLESILALATLSDVVHRAPLLSRQPGGALSGTNVYGAIGFEVGSQPGCSRGKLAASTQLF